MAQNNPFADAFKSIEAFKQTPSIDFNEWISAGKRNVESFQEAGQVVADGIQSIAKLQSEVFQANAQNALNLFNEIASSKDPRESASKQADFAKKAFEKASSDAKEISEIASKVNAQAAEIISKQFSDNINELTKQSATKKPANKAA